MSQDRTNFDASYAVARTPPNETRRSLNDGSSPTLSLADLLEQLLSNPDTIQYLRAHDPELDRAYTMKEMMAEFRGLITTLMPSPAHLSATTQFPQASGQVSLVESLIGATEELKAQRALGEQIAKLEQERSILDRQLETLVESVAEYLRIVQTSVNTNPDITLAKLRDQHQGLGQLLGSLGLDRLVPAVGDTYNPAEHETTSPVTGAAQILTVEVPGLRWHNRRVLRKAQVTVAPLPTDN